MKQIFIVLSLVLLFATTSCDKRPSNQLAASSESMSGLHPYLTAGDPNIGRAFRIACGDLTSNVVPLSAISSLSTAPLPQYMGTTLIRTPGWGYRHVYQGIR
jgi:hypothetical protein